METDMEADGPRETLETRPGEPGFSCEATREIERVIKLFYGQAAPEEKAVIDDVLKAAQKSDAGFKQADILMRSEDINVRHFAASTFSLQANTRLTLLDEHARQEVLEHLLKWLTSSVAADEPGFLIRKLCSALAAVFRTMALKTGDWVSCVVHVLRSLAAGVPVIYGGDKDEADENMVAQLPEKALQAMLWFGTALFEHVLGTTVGAVDPEGERLFEATNANIRPLLMIFGRAMTRGEVLQPSEHTTVKDALELLKTLIKYVELKSRLENAIYLDRIRGFVASIIREFRTARLFSESVDFVTELVDDHYSWLTQGVTQLIAEEFASQHFMSQLFDFAQGQIENENIACVRLVILYGTADCDSLVWDSEHGANSHLINVLLNLTQFSECATNEELGSALLDFWSLYVETACETLPHQGPIENKAPKLGTATLRTQRVFEAFLLKFKLPPDEMFQSWDSDSRAKFKDLRTEFRDFSSIAYGLLGPGFLGALVDHAIEMSKTNDWATVEVTLQSIRGCLEVVDDSSEGHQTLATLLEPLFKSLATLGLEEKPISTMRILLRIISENSSFFKYQSLALLPCLKFLFDCLDVTSLETDETPLASVAARAIATVCDDCRIMLTSEVERLASFYQQFVKSKKITQEIKVDLVGAVAGLVQASWAAQMLESRELEAAKILHILLSSIEQDLADSSTDSSPEALQDAARTSMLCLSSIGKAFRQPDSEIIDLEDRNQVNLGPNYSSCKLDIQRKITDLMVRVLEAYPTDGEIMEGICDVIRAGITESETNPFAFPPDVMVSLLENYIMTTSRPGYLLETASRFLRKQTPNPRDESFPERYLHIVLQAFPAAEGRLDADPEYVASIIKFVTNYMQLYPKVLFNEAGVMVLKPLIEASITCLTLPEPQLKQSASTFWSKLFDNRTEDPESYPFSDLCITNYGQQLALALVLGIGGDAHRSDLEFLTQPLRKLVFRGGHAMVWIQQALESDRFPSDRVTSEDKKLFLQQIFKLRGDARTRDIVKQFWVKCRGTFSG